MPMFQSVFGRSTSGWPRVKSPINLVRMLRCIKAAVRERDDNRCVDCGARRQPGKPQLDVHRIIPGSEYSVDGCVTLCRGCHKHKPKLPGLRVHKSNGRRAKVGA
jgi:5-methylcytosine-specific restriction endonuclease McrA